MTPKDEETKKAMMEMLSAYGKTVVASNPKMKLFMIAAQPSEAGERTGDAVIAAVTNMTDPMALEVIEEWIAITKSKAESLPN